MRIVSKFLDIFSEELLGFPTIRESEFSIYLLLGNTPVSKAPYRMTPIESQEVKLQLKEFLDKFFIQPGVSMWGSLVLFYKEEG